MLFVVCVNPSGPAKVRYVRAICLTTTTCVHSIPKIVRPFKKCTHGQVELVASPGRCQIGHDPTILRPMWCCWRSRSILWWSLVHKRRGILPQDAVSPNWDRLQLPRLASELSQRTPDSHGGSSVADWLELTKNPPWNPISWQAISAVLCICTVSWLAPTKT